MAEAPPWRAESVAFDGDCGANEGGLVTQEYNSFKRNRQGGGKRCSQRGQGCAASVVLFAESFDLLAKRGAGSQPKDAVGLFPCDKRMAIVGATFRGNPVVECEVFK